MVMTFTEEFDALSLDQKNQFASDERKKRAKENTDKYVSMPIAIPLMGKLSPNPIAFKLGWAIGTPGILEDPEGRPVRAALTLGFPSEETACDFCHAMNKARAEQS